MTTDTRQAAEQRMLFAKRRFSEAARLALAGSPDAEEMARAAFAEIQQCRAALHALDNE